jgi:hypothetical protein
MAHLSVALVRCLIVKSAKSLARARGRTSFGNSIDFQTVVRQMFAEQIIVAVTPF